MYMEQNKNKNKGKPGPRPNMWKTGPDALTHKKYRQYVQQRNQALWRKETWTLSFVKWCDIWGDLFELRGRTPESYCMTRLHSMGPWDETNTTVITRQQHFIKYRNRGKFVSNEQRDNLSEN